MPVRNVGSRGDMGKAEAHLVPRRTQGVGRVFDLFFWIWCSCLVFVQVLSSISPPPREKRDFLQEFCLY